MYKVVFTEGKNATITFEIIPKIKTCLTVEPFAAFVAAENLFDALLYYPMSNTEYLAMSEALRAFRRGLNLWLRDEKNRKRGVRGTWVRIDYERVKDFVILK